MKAKLALLLYYTLLYRAWHPASPKPAGGRDLIALAAKGDELTWAAAALATLQGLTQPGYQLDLETRLSPFMEGMIPDTLHATITLGLVESLTPVRRLCAPENQAAYRIAERAALIIRDLRDPQLEAIVERILKRTWLAAIRGCPKPDKEERLLREAKDRILSGLAPLRYRTLLPLLETLLKGRKAPERSETGWIYSDEYAELEALAAALEAYNAPITPASVRRGVYETRETPKTIVCHQPALQVDDCRLQPDIAILNNKTGTIILIEVKTLSPNINPQERLRQARRQLIEYIYALQHPNATICGENPNTYPSRRGVIAYKSYESIEAGITDACAERLGILITQTQSLTERILAINSPDGFASSAGE